MRRPIPEEDIVYCVECGGEHHVDELGAAIKQTSFGPLCEDCRIWCVCGDFLVPNGQVCEHCRELGPEEFKNRADYDELQKRIVIADALNRGVAA